MQHGRIMPKEIMEMLSSINKNNIGQKLKIKALVKNIIQTSGPTIFVLRDFSGEIKATGFNKAGERAFPEIEVGDEIIATGIIRFRDKLEFQIENIKKLETSREFLIKSKNLEKLKSEFKNAQSLIKKALDKRFILIRHHDDTDGYVAGYALENAIKPLLNERLNIGRSASRSPYYHYVDALKDLNYYLPKKKYFEKPPLIILCDLGSNSQSIKALTRLRDYGIDFVIIDHHLYDDANKRQAKIYINPREKGFDVCAGALGVELAYLINPTLNFRHLPALAGVADKSSSNEHQKYVKLSGYNIDYLEKWALVSEHELFYLKFSESSELLEDIFILNHSKIIKHFYPKIKEEFDAVKKSVEKYARIIQYEKFKTIIIDKHDITHRSEFTSSKITRIAHESFNGPRITLAISEDSISFRADQVNFSVISLLHYLKKILPYAQLSGGGHDNAGGIKFIVASKSEIIDEIKKYLEKL